MLFSKTNVLLMALGALGGWEPLLFIILFAVILGLWIAALKNILSGNFKSAAHKWQWIALVTLLPFIGPLLYLVLGRKQDLN